MDERFSKMCNAVDQLMGMDDQAHREIKYWETRADYSEAIRWARLWYPFLILASTLGFLGMGGVTSYTGYLLGCYGGILFSSTTGGLLVFIFIIEIVVTLMLCATVAGCWYDYGKMALMCWWCPAKYYREYCVKKDEKKT